MGYESVVAYSHKLGTATHDRLRAAAHELCAVGKLLHTKAMVASNDGNLSIKLNDDLILCTPTGVSKGALEPEKLVLTDREGNQLAGTLKPSSEHAMHLRMYEVRPDAKAVCHAHPTFATVYAVHGTVPKLDLVAETVVLMPEIVVAPFGVPSTKEVADSLDVITSRTSACLLEHHGALTWGPDIMSAYYDMERLEHVAKLSLIAEVSGKARSMDTTKLSRLAQVFPATY